MLFIDWQTLGTYFILAFLIAVAISGLMLASGKTLVLRISAYVTLVPVAICGALFAMLMTAASGCNTYSEPLYSPDGKSAARLWNSDGGALGGDTAVELYTAHGLRSGAAYGGFWHTVEPRDLHWTSNTDLVLNYESGGTTYPSYCRSAAGVNVHCIIKPAIVAPNPDPPPNAVN